MTDDELAKLDEARAKMSAIALNLTRVIDPLDAASVLMGAGLTLLGATIGKDGAVSYLHELADMLAASNKTELN